METLSDLTAHTLYRAEVATLPRYTPAEEAELVRRARNGEQEAGLALVLGCLAAVLRMAWRFYLAYRPAHDDVLDLAQAASLEMLQALPRALEKRHPAAYLKGIARQEMVVLTLYHSSLIRKPELPLARLAAASIPFVGSLDALASEPAHQSGYLDPDQGQRFAPLYEALAQLTPRQQRAVAQRYGVGERDPEFSGQVESSVLRNLRSALQPFTTQLLLPE